MIAVEQLNKRARLLHDDISSAKVFLNDVETKGNIIKKSLKNNLITIFVSLSNDSGTVSRVELYDKDNDLVQFQDMQFVKTARSGYIAVLEILVEGETVYES